jgi:BirA family transcriptional regulator, biotin operon repressor / biotin---[acetyl-CoA-carboxylase] ligase
VDASPDGVWTGLLRTADVRRALEAGAIVRAAHGVGEVGSTQDLALALARDGSPSGTVVVADVQTAGRGRAGRSWEDRAGGGTLAMTVLLDADVVGDASLVPHALGVAVVDACGPAVPAATPLRLKWPNDVVHRATPSSPARKLCGVLVEREQLRAQGCGRDVLLCGVGIDVDLRGDGAADRVCLAELSGGALDRVALLAALIAAVDRSFAMLADAPSALMERYRSVSDTVGRAVDVVPIAPMRPGPGGSEPIRGVAAGVDDRGRLLVTTDGVTHAILSGTVRDVVTDAATDGGQP